MINHCPHVVVKNAMESNVPETQLRVRKTQFSLPVGPKSKRRMTAATVCPQKCVNSAPEA